MSVRMMVVRWYEVFDIDFNKIGRVQAVSPEAALRAAKEKWKFVPGLMVAPV